MATIKKLVPFDAFEAKKGAPVKLQNGIPVKILGYDDGGYYPIFGVFQAVAGKTELGRWNEQGEPEEPLCGDTIVIEVDDIDFFPPSKKGPLEDPYVYRLQNENDRLQKLVDSMSKELDILRVKCAGAKNKIDTFANARDQYHEAFKALIS